MKSLVFCASTFTIFLILAVTASLIGADSGLLAAFIQDLPLSLDPEVTVINDVQVGSVPRQFGVNVVNTSNQPIRIIGLRGICGGISVVEQLPVEVPPHGSRSILMRAGSFRGNGHYSKSFALFYDRDGVRVLPGRVVATLSQAPAGN